MILVGFAVQTDTLIPVLTSSVVKHHLSLFVRLLVSASQDGKLIIWDSYTTNKVNIFSIFGTTKMMSIM